MKKFESSIKQIPYSQEAVYRNISDLTNLERVRDRVPEDKVKDFSFDHDSVTVSVAPVGAITMRIVFCTIRSPLEAIKVRSVQSSSTLAPGWRTACWMSASNCEALSVSMRLSV